MGTFLQKFDFLSAPVFNLLRPRSDIPPPAGVPGLSNHPLGEGWPRLCEIRKSDMMSEGSRGESHGKDHLGY
jgi:hypothetical protein